MHKFYDRITRVFKRNGTNRHRFCKKMGYNYQTLQSYWGTDKLPPGNFLEDVAREFHVSLDKLVLGRVSVSIGEDSPTLARLTLILKQKSEAELLQIEGAVAMLEARNAENDLEELPLAPDDDASEDE